MGDGQGRIVLFLIFETAIACMSKHAGNTTKHLLDSQAPIPCQTSSFTREFSLSTNQSAPLEVNVSRFCRGKSIFKYYPRPDPSLHNAPPTHAGPVHSVIPGSGHNHTYRRTSSATAKRLYVLGAARTRHLPALEFPAQCSLWPVYSRRLRSPESAPSARL